MAKGLWSMIQEEFMKENLKMTADKAMAMRNTITITFTLVISVKVKLMVKGSTHGQMESITKENGTWAKSTVSENGKGREERHISEIGEKEKLMEWGPTHGKMGTFMKVIGWTV